MSRIEYLIQELCPSGVPYFLLEDLVEISNTGIDKKIRTEERSVNLLNFTDVFKNRKITQGLISAKGSASPKKIKDCQLISGDVLVTPSSELKNEIGRAAVVIEDLELTLYSYHLMRLRIHNQEKLLPNFLVFLFEANLIQSQIAKLASGLTRFGLTKNKWESLKIPVPPIKVQREIVSILDKFTELGVELEAELEARKKQFDYFRNDLFNSSSKNRQFEYVQMSEIFSMAAGKHISAERISITSVEGKQVPCFGGNGIRGYVTKANNVGPNLIIGRQGALCGNISRINSEYYATEHAVVVKPKVEINMDWAYHKLTHMNLNQYATKSAQPGLTVGSLQALRIYLPPLAIQNQIATALNRLETLLISKSFGLPAEIAARRKQYEYYREKLLNFKEFDAA